VHHRLAFRAWRRCAVLALGPWIVACGGDDSSSSDAGIGDASPDGTTVGDATGDSPENDVAPRDAGPDSSTDDASGSDAEGDSGDGDTGSFPPPDASACSLSAYTTTVRSGGFGGTDNAYFDLFDSLACTSASDCVAPCMNAGGTTASCAQGSQCLPDLCPDGGSDCVECLPPTYWLDPQGASGTPGSGNGAVAANDVQAFDNGYNDSLVATGFHLALPSGAVVRGIAFLVDRSANDDNAADANIRIVKGGTAIGTDHASDAHWPQTYATATYGGPADTWGATWTTDDIAAADFGISITPQYLMSAGNDSVQVDSIAVTVYYGGTAGCP
jgi:hypothetical protein